MSLGDTATGGDSLDLDDVTESPALAWQTSFQFFGVQAAPLFVDGARVHDADGHPCFTSDGVPSDVQSIGSEAVYGDVFFDVEVPVAHGGQDV